MAKTLPQEKQISLLQCLEASLALCSICNVCIDHPLAFTNLDLSDCTSVCMVICLLESKLVILVLRVVDYRLWLEGVRAAEKVNSSGVKVNGAEKVSFNLITHSLAESGEG